MKNTDKLPFHVTMLKRAVGSMMTSSTPPSKERIERFESMYELKLPQSIKAMTEAVGDVKGTKTEYQLLGLSDDKTHQPTISSVLAYMRSSYPSLPTDLLPVESLPQNQVACAILDGSEKPPICMIDLDDPDFTRMPIAPSYEAFCFDWLNDLRGMEAIISFQDKQNKAVICGERVADQLHRPNEWRVHRYCSQDVLVGASLLRYNRDKGVTEIAAFSCAGLTAHDPEAPVRALLTLVLSESYRCGGNLSLQFVNRATYNPNTTRVPARIERFAKNCGIKLKNIKTGFIDSEEAKSLYIASLVCSESYRNLIKNEDYSLNVASSCFVVANGLWDTAAAEYLLRNSYNSSRVFAGDATPLDAIQWATDFRDAANAYLISSYIKWLNTQSCLDNLHDTEDEESQYTAAFTDYGTIILSGKNDLGYDAEQAVGDKVELFAVYGGHDELDGKLTQLAGWLKENARCENASLLLCKDSKNLNASELQAAEASFGIKAEFSPLYSTTIMSEAMRKLERARVSRL